MTPDQSPNHGANRTNWIPEQTDAPRDLGIGAHLHSHQNDTREHCRDLFHRQTQSIALSPLQMEMWARHEKDHQKLLRLRSEPARDVFGDELLEEAMRKPQRLIVGCMDEGVRGPKIAVAGSGVLMTFTEPMLRMTDDQLYTYLADPISGDQDFARLVEHVQEKRSQGIEVKVSEHEECGAVGIFCSEFERQSGRKLDPGRVATAVAARLHTALKLPGEHAKITFDAKDAHRMHRPRGIHVAHAFAVGEGDMGRLGVHALQTSAPLFASPEYIEKETRAGFGIMAGPHGLGLHDAPLVIIGEEPNARTMDTLKSVAKDRAILRMRRPQRGN